MVPSLLYTPETSSSWKKNSSNESTKPRLLFTRPSLKAWPPAQYAPSIQLRRPESHRLVHFSSSAWCINSSVHLLCKISIPSTQTFYARCQTSKISLTTSPSTSTTMILSQSLCNPAPISQKSKPSASPSSAGRSLMVTLAGYYVHSTVVPVIVPILFFAPTEEIV